MNDVASYLTPFLITALGVIGWYFIQRVINLLDKHSGCHDALSRAMSDLKRDVDDQGKILKSHIDDLPKLIANVRGIRARFEHFEKQLEIALVAASKVAVLQDEIAVLKRNQATQWARIDETKLDVEALRSEMETFAGMIADFRRHVMEKDGEIETIKGRG